MQTFTRILTPLLLIALLLAICPLSASAAATATIAFSSSTLTPGDTLTATITFTAETVGAVDASLSYDSTVLQFVSGNGVSGGGGVLQLATYASAEGSSLQTVLTFKALAAGSCTIRITGSSVYAWDETLAGSPTAGATVKVTDASLSQNANLKSLTLSAGTLSPAFSPSVTAYTVTVENRVTSLTISAIAAESGASVAISGSATLPEGTSRRTITITAPGGATKVYTITITRLSATTQALTTTTTTSTTSGETTTTAPPQDDPCLLAYEGTLYMVATDLSDKTLPEGYTVANISCGEYTVPAAQSPNGAIHLLWLTAAENDVSAESGAFFVYNAEQDALFPYRPLATANGTFLLRPVGEETPDTGLSTAEWELEGQTVPVWTFSEPELATFCVFYAMDSDGETGFFRYDALKKTAQRYIILTATTPAVITTTTSAVSGETTAAPGNSAFAEWTLFGISAGWFVAGGLLLVCIALAVLAVIFWRRNLTPPKH